MTREEAKEELQSMCDHLHAHGICDKDSNMLTACKMAISALEQKPYDVQKIYDLKTGLSDWDVLPKLEQKPCEDIAQERYKDLCEYFGGAKDILKSREDFKAWLGRVKWHIHKAEELYEKAFMDGFESCSDLFTRNKEQQPCDDVVSRQAVIYYIKGHIHEIITESGTDKNAHTNSILKALINGVETMPTVNPQPCEDAISREDVIKLVECSGYDLQFGIDNDDMCDDVMKLPSVTQKSGEWILLDECANSGYYCSRCQKKLVKEGWSDTVKKIKFCPNCGAKMESEEKE